MSDFSKAIGYVLENEGLTYTNYPADSGGPTKMGITQETLAQWRKKPVSPDDVKDLTEDEAKQIYEAYYWLPLGCDKIRDQGIATALLDVGVLNGIGTCARWVQGIVGSHQDGHIGPQTESAINAFDPKILVLKLISKVIEHDVAVCVANIKNTAFIMGWTDRALRLITLIIS